MPKEELPFFARYSLSRNLSEHTGELSWETVATLSVDLHSKAKDRASEVKKALKELQMSRLLLLDRIRHCTAGGKADPKLLVETLRLIRRTEEIAHKYELDLGEFSAFMSLVSEKLKREKLARHEVLHPATIGEELAAFKMRSEEPTRGRGEAKARKRGRIAGGKK